MPRVPRPLPATGGPGRTRAERGRGARGGRAKQPRAPPPPILSDARKRELCVRVGAVH